MLIAFMGRGVHKEEKYRKKTYWLFSAKKDTLSLPLLSYWLAASLFIQEKGRVEQKIILHLEKQMLYVIAAKVIFTRGRLADGNI